ncbi:PadR family transcriptional regulator [Paenibacillus crassostreae]|uniref:PadR family transcriptional regulator n=1 Tax=Paenibacillus crassostreae TaxID=1763538 RepID=A0A167BAN5_9BACL|nr:PadR family transcriptional regulator [Paenibacillus crassostreae]AOZ93019.1 PadR family transcriptional regulator [Paenibacillus crassostreae]OAB71892.1 PadR family transcriptional regulator [Paenibacillus crassostreae]
MVNLIVLALLRQRPMHGYEIQQIIQTSRMDLWANLLSGSIYYSLNKMERDSLVRTDSEERTGARLRKIYAITEKGEELFQNLIRETLTLSPHSVKSDFTLGLSWIDAIPKEDALELLNRNLKQVEETLLLWHSGKELKMSYGLSALGEASFDNAIALLEQDLTYIKRIIDLLE